MHIRIDLLQLTEMLILPIQVDINTCGKLTEKSVQQYTTLLAQQTQIHNEMNQYFKGAHVTL